MLSFDYEPRTRIVYGAGKTAELGRLARELGATRALMVSDPGIVAAGHAGRGLESLRAAGLETELYSEVQENPTTECVERGLAYAQRFHPDFIVGLGGGSSMDTAKGINFLISNGGQMKDYWGRDKAKLPMLPMIAVPTTAGTGSETQSFALISDAHTHVKMACGDKKAACKIAILDPDLTVTQPQRVTALTGLDALSHALETFVTRVRTPLSLAFSREAWRLLQVHFPQVLKDPQNLEARGGMQLGACLAGVAIENAMLGAAHACANPLTARYDVVHGQAVAVMLPHVIHFNGQEFDHWYRDLPLHGSSASAGELMDFMTEMVVLSGLQTRLRDLGVTFDALPDLAREAARQWTAGFNPRPVGEADLLALYRAAF